MTTLSKEQLAFVQSLLRKPWVRGELDCWGLAVLVERDLFGRTLPLIPEPPADQTALVQFVAEHTAARKQWQVVPSPVHGGVVELARSQDPFHIGVYLNIDGGGLLHTLRHGGVRFDSLLALRASGWRRMVFHDWIG